MYAYSQVSTSYLLRFYFELRTGCGTSPSAPDVVVQSESKVYHLFQSALLISARGLQVRLNSPCSGRVQVQFEGQWGPVCSHSWDLRDAEVLCQQLGCGAAVAAPHLLHPQDASEDRVLSRVGCLGNETELGECRAGPLGAKDCQHPWDAAVICAAHREPRIVGREQPCSGRVELQFGDQWGTLCDSDWDLQDASVVCRQLQCGEAVAIPGGAHYGEGRGPVWDEQLDCLGNESTVFECPVSTKKGPNCTHRNDASVICSGQGGPRLVGGESRCSGRLEVLRGALWGSVCDRHLDLQTADVICRHLQCGGAAATPRGAPYGAGSGPLWKDRFHCSGSEGRLGDCPLSWDQEDCDQGSVASVVCSDADWQVRLRGTDSRCEGRLEVLWNGSWGRVLDSQWDLQDASAVCTNLHCGRALLASNSTEYGHGDGPVVLTAVECTGQEPALQNCTLTLSSGPGSTSGGVGVRCSEHWRLRLAGGGSQCAGRVEVYHGGAWGSVCDDLWDLADASVVCRQLGCGQALRATGSAEFGGGSGPVWLDDVSCRGNETALWDCPRASWERHNCRHKEDAGVVCSEHKELRLVSAEHHCAGRLDVLYNGTWGSVCSNGMMTFTVALVCQQLQCGDSGSLQDGEQYETDSGPKWLDRVDCRGHESVLWQCPAAPWGHNDCQDSEVAHIQCARPRLRLVGPEGRCSGRVEVCLMGVWGTVCDDSWDLQDARVVCRELGCGSAISAPQEAHWGEGNGTLWLDEVSCRGTERALLECRSSPPGSHDCTHKEDAAVLCAGPDAPVTVADPAEGLSKEYEAVYEEIDQKCHRYQSHRAQLSADHPDDGYDDVADSVQPEAGYDDVGGGDSRGTEDRESQLDADYDDIEEQDGVSEVGGGGGGAAASQGKSSQGSACGLEAPDPEEKHCANETGISLYDDIGNYLEEEDTAAGGLQVRLSSPCSGRVQVQFEGQWGPVCSHSWDLRNAEVLCQQLGCGAAVAAPHLLHPTYASEDRVLSRVGCLGNETELGECRAGPLGAKDCQHPWDAAVICAGTSA
ncbi:scavenger receptor cysteine-rich type 1 protein M130-like [Amia ocellicauda]|uniref:scavenger receptor cysteine-rich type 1 protein M130-like n=1 Tax=Amia ocellicauda TaxID=2972642 RepID=UPI003463A115